MLYLGKLQDSVHAASSLGENVCLDHSQTLPQSPVRDRARGQSHFLRQPDSLGTLPGLALLSQQTLPTGITKPGSQAKAAFREGVGTDTDGAVRRRADFLLLLRGLRTLTGSIAPTQEGFRETWASVGTPESLLSFRQQTGHSLMRRDKPRVRSADFQNPWVQKR